MLTSIVYGHRVSIAAQGVVGICPKGAKIREESGDVTTEIKVLEGVDFISSPCIISIKVCSGVLFLEIRRRISREKSSLFMPNEL